MNNERSFLWAQGVTANVVEPLEALKEQGWRAGNVPAAANFNWIFKTLTEEMAALRKDQLVHKDEMVRLIEQTAKEISEAKAEIHRVDKKATSILHKVTRMKARLDWILIILRQVCRQLKAMDANLQRLLPGFVSQPWPLEESSSAEIEDEIEETIPDPWT
jgi:hypothetical protein